MPAAPTPTSNPGGDEAIGEFRPGMGLTTKLLGNGLITVLCAVMVAGTTIWSSMAFSHSLGEVTAAADALAGAAARGHRRRDNSNRRRRGARRNGGRGGGRGGASTGGGGPETMQQRCSRCAAHWRGAGARLTTATNETTRRFNLDRSDARRVEPP